ncbi:hypothetical protein [Sphingopyxis sp. DBS4]|uniref:hypothetical protein n=1 Tax=Sphingopyxis sp. DBS4 TaxID=2968500 RepID=UPI00214BE9BE|nr:hypothetical protein [Sphingopyxis sp. DBS4]
MNRRWLRATAASATLFAALFVAATALAPQPRLIWNASPSVPIGFYRVDVGAKPAVGDLILFHPPEAVAARLAVRGYGGGLLVLSAGRADRASRRRE